MSTKQNSTGKYNHMKK